MSIINRNRHFVSDCDRALARLYKDQEAVQKLIKLQGETDHLVYSRDSIKRSMNMWEQRHQEATLAFERGLDIWFFWLWFYRGTFEDQSKRRLIF